MCRGGPGWARESDVGTHSGPRWMGKIPVLCLFSELRGIGEADPDDANGTVKARESANRYDVYAGGC